MKAAQLLELVASFSGLIMQEKKALSAATAQGALFGYPVKASAMFKTEVSIEVHVAQKPDANALKYMRDQLLARGLDKKSFAISQAEEEEGTGSTVGWAVGGLVGGLIGGAIDGAKNKNKPPQPGAFVLTIVFKGMDDNIDAIRARYYEIIRELKPLLDHMQIAPPYPMQYQQH